MKKGCLLLLLQAAVLTGLYYLALRGRVTQSAAQLGALVGGVSLSLVIGAFRQSWKERRGRALLDRALTGAPYEDGQRIAAVGPILALGAPVLAPFSGDPCVFCAWEVSHKSSSKGGKSIPLDVKDFSGFLMTPCVVQAPTGNVRILGFPALEGFPEAAQRSNDDFLRARPFLESTSFEKVNTFKAFSNVEALVADEHGHLRKVWRMAGDDFVLNHTVHTLEERIVKDGETVCALGRYSAEKKGLVPGFDPRGAGLDLIRGDSPAVRETLTDSFKGFAAMGVLLFLVSHFFLFLYVADRGSESRYRREFARDEAFIQAILDRDMKAVTEELDAGFDPNHEDEYGRTPLLMVQDPRIARRLISGGADVNAPDDDGQTPLISAVLAQNLELVRVFLQAGADVHTCYLDQNALDWALEHHWKDEEDQEEVVKILRQAGAKEQSP